jgi:hypothetical protein
MADSKITALTALTAADPANDMIPIVDVSDTPPASGNTKRISINNILACSPSATLASATISGNLLAGTTNNFASSRLCVQGTAGTSTPDVTIGIPVNASSNTNLAIGRSASTGGYIYLDAYKAGVGGTELVLNSINGGSVLVGLSTVVAAGGCLQLKSGITFPATQVASSDVNTLDDYEEGTFTPTIVGSTSAGTGTYTTNTGKYTKIGNVVTFQVYINWTAHTGTGNMRIGNLPFTNGNAFWAGSFGFIANIALTAGYVLTGYVEASSSYVTLSQTPVGGGVASDVPIDTAGTIVFSASYTV